MGNQDVKAVRIRDPDHLTVEDQEQSLRDVCPVLADMIADGWNLAIGHGNGPQVGFIARRSEIAHRVEGMHEVPLDVCTADTQGAIGYELQQALQNELFHRGTRLSRIRQSRSGDSWTRRRQNNV